MDDFLKILDDRENKKNENFNKINHNLLFVNLKSFYN